MDFVVSSTTIGYDVVEDDDLIGSQVTAGVFGHSYEERYLATVGAFYSTSSEYYNIEIGKWNDGLFFFHF